MLIFDCTYADTGVPQKPVAVEGGCLPVYWTPGNGSPGDGTYRWNDLVLTASYAKEAAYSHPWPTRLSVCDFEGAIEQLKNQEKVDEVVRMWVKNVRRITPGQLLTTYAYWMGHGIPEDLLIQDWNAALGSKRTAAQSEIRLRIRERCRQQRDIVRMMGTVALPATLTEPESFDRDLLYIQRHASLYREFYGGSMLIAWASPVWGFQELKGQPIGEPYLSRWQACVKKCCDAVLVWYPDWRKATAMLEVLTRMNP